MNVELPIELPLELGIQLTKTANHLQQSEPSLIVDVLRAYLEDYEDACDAAAAYDSWQRSGQKSIPFDKVLKDSGLA